MEILTIKQALQGWRIWDSITGKEIYYICGTLREAIAAHRQAHNLKYKHFKKIMY
jgi:hypothetical protein